MLRNLSLHKKIIYTLLVLIVLASLFFVIFPPERIISERIIWFLGVILPLATLYGLWQEEMKTEIDATRLNGIKSDVQKIRDHIELRPKLELYFLPEENAPLKEMSIKPVFYDLEAVKQKVAKKYPPLEQIDEIFSGSRRKYLIRTEIYEAKIKKFSLLEFILMGTEEAPADNIHVFIKFPEVFNIFENLPEKPMPPDQNPISGPRTATRQIEIKELNGEKEVYYMVEKLAIGMNCKFGFYVTCEKEGIFSLVYSIGCNQGKFDGELKVRVSPIFEQ